MRFSSLRFTIRRMMIATACIGLFIGLAVRGHREWLRLMVERCEIVKIDGREV